MKLPRHVSDKGVLWSQEMRLPRRKNALTRLKYSVQL
jgi:hypothetical protein